MSGERWEVRDESGRCLTVWCRYDDAMRARTETNQEGVHSAYVTGESWPTWKKEPNRNLPLETLLRHWVDYRMHVHLFGKTWNELTPLWFFHHAELHPTSKGSGS